MLDSSAATYLPGCSLAQEAICCYCNFCHYLFYWLGPPFCTIASHSTEGTGAPGREKPFKSRPNWWSSGISCIANCICFFLYICILAYLHICIFVFFNIYSTGGIIACSNISIFVHLYICIFVYLCICIFVYLFICLFVHLYICIFVYLYNW